MMDPRDLEACTEAIRHGSLSFHAASKLLPKKVRDPALALYAFCRLAVALSVGIVSVRGPRGRLVILFRLLGLGDARCTVRKHEGCGDGYVTFGHVSTAHQRRVGQCSTQRQGGCAQRGYAKPRGDHRELGQGVFPADPLASRTCPRGDRWFATFRRDVKRQPLRQYIWRSLIFFNTFIEGQKPLRQRLIGEACQLRGKRCGASFSHWNDGDARRSKKS